MCKGGGFRQHIRKTCPKNCRQLPRLLLDIVRLYTALTTYDRNAAPDIHLSQPRSQIQIDHVVSNRLAAGSRLGGTYTRDLEKSSRCERQHRRQYTLIVFSLLRCIAVKLSAVCTPTKHEASAHPNFPDAVLRRLTGSKKLNGSLVLYLRY